MTDESARLAEHMSAALDAFALTFHDGDFWDGSPGQIAARRIAAARGGIEEVRKRFDASIAKPTSEPDRPG